MGYTLEIDDFDRPRSVPKIYTNGARPLSPPTRLPWSQILLLAAGLATLCVASTEVLAAWLPDAMQAAAALSVGGLAVMGGAYARATADRGTAETREPNWDVAMDETDVVLRARFGAYATHVRAEYLTWTPEHSEDGFEPDLDETADRSPPRSAQGGSTLRTRLAADSAERDPGIAPVALPSVAARLPATMTTRRESSVEV